MANRKVFKRDKALTQGFQITQTDLSVVESVGKYRLILGDQLRQIHWPKTEQKSHAESRLRLLYHAGWLDRIPMLDGISRPRVVYFLGKSGRTYVRDRWNVLPEALGTRPAKEKLHDLLFLKHHLDTVQIAINVTCAAEQLDGQVSEFRSEWVLRALSRRDKALLPLIPDAFVTLDLRGRSQSFCIELDRGSVHTRAWRERLAAYWKWTHSTAYSRDFGSPAILIVVSSEGHSALRRLEALKQLIETEAKLSGQDPSLFCLTTLNEATTSSVLTDGVWRIGGEAEPQSLMPSSARTEVFNHEPLAVPA